VPAPLSIGQMARRFGVSRSTLLYYDRIGLLCPSGRSSADYRLYGPPDVERMELIDAYRQVGLPLADIARVLASGPTTLTERLELRLRALNAEIKKLRGQQKLIVELLRSDAARRASRGMDKAGWVAILRAAGFDEAGMRRWHVEFERLSPEAHQDFLESLGLDDAEIGEIRAASRVGAG